MKLKIPRFGLKKIFRYILLLLFTSVIFFVIGISLPETERYINNQQYDLNLLDKDLVAKQYIIDVNFSADQVIDKYKYVNQTKNTIQNRLNNFDVEYFNINYDNIDETKGQFLISIFSAKDHSTIQSILSQRGELKIVVKKDEADFEDEKDPYARYLETNYNDSGIKRSELRTIYITQLKTTDGSNAYFGILKPWIWNNKKYDKFLLDNSGKEGGLSIDGFVTPTSVPVFEGATYNSAKPIFAVGVATEQASANLQDIIFNSGSIPIEYSFKEVKELTQSIPTFDYLRVGGLLVILSLIVTLILNMGNISVPNISILSLFFLFTSFIAYIKLFAVPILSLSIILCYIAVFLFNIIYQNSKEKLLITLLIFSLLLALYIIDISITSLIFPYLLALLALYPVFSYLTERYINLFLETLRK